MREVDFPHVICRVVKLKVKFFVRNICALFITNRSITIVSGIEPVILTEPYKISIYDNFSLIFLALLLIDYPVLLSDIINWITDGTLCFFNTARFLPDYFKPRRLVNTALGVRTIPSVDSLSERFTIVIDNLDDIQKPLFNYSSVDKIFSNLLK